MLPHVNAALNATALALLLAGFAFIRGGKVVPHAASMISAFVVSSAFLACYVTYHYALEHYTGSSSRPFGGTGGLRIAYLSILFTHSPLAVFVPVLALRMMFLAWRCRWADHRRWAKVTFPVWVYVSATGVIIYLMLYHLPIARGAA
jgi:protein SCO1/2/putative membrane protein